MRVLWWMAVLLALSHALEYPPHSLMTSETKGQSEFPKKWFTQKLDHFNAEETREFQQKYYVNDKYFSDPGNPVILYINGEGPVFGPPSKEGSEIVELAEAHKALIVTLEHRYYGESVPTGDLSTENLQWLSSKQALVDLAEFRAYIQSGLRAQRQDSGDLSTTDNPWLVAGGSYSGALTAWFRVKFPHLTKAGIASSGVVNAILDFTAFDEQIAESAGAECAAALRVATKSVETLVDAGTASATAIKERFLVPGNVMNDDDFYYMIADAQVMGIQYGYHDELCAPLVAAYKLNESAVLDAFVNYTVSFFYKVLDTQGYVSYTTQYQKNITSDISQAARQWWWQKCSEVAYFQNAPAVGSIRSKHVNMDYHRSHCAAVFGIPIFPDTVATNVYYGGDHPACTNTVFVNGSQIISSYVAKWLSQ